MKKIVLLILILSCFQFSTSQNTVGTISITNDAYDAFTLFTIHEKTYLVNNCGELINEWTSTYPPGVAVYLLPNGNLLRAGATDDSTSSIAFGGQGGIVELFDWENNLLWSYTYSTNNHRLHHDIYPMPNGNILVLAAEVLTQSEAIQAGRDSSILIDNELYNERIMELQPVGTNQANIIWEWNAKDHLIQDFDATKNNFGIVASNPQRIDVNFLNGGTGSKNWLHINSIQYDDTRDQIIISTRNLSEFWIVDHSTTIAESSTNSGGTYGKGGDLLYRWGNPQSYKQGTETDRKLFGQHYPHYISSELPNAGKIILFNNGIQRTPSFSQVDIITPPETSLGIYDYTLNTAYLPSTTDYTYTDLSSNPSSFFSAIVSSAQQLENGNILICEGREGHIFEINANEDIVWEYIVPISNTGAISAQMGIPPSINLIFRANKYPLNYSAFTGRDVTPGNPIETNFNTTPCDNLSTLEFETTVASVYPNPSSGIIHIKSLATIHKIEAFDMLGKKISDSFKNSINLVNKKDGVYFLKIYTDKGIVQKKVIKS